MPARTVQVRRSIAADAGKAWAVLRDFARPWHPLIEWMRAERDATGGLERMFKAHGEDTIYREHLSYLSDSRRTLRYVHIAGIRDAQRYAAEIQVVAEAPERCTIIWSADIESPEPRLREIAEGTRFVFERGIDALAELPDEGAAAPAVKVADVPLTDLVIDGEPALAITHTPARPGPLVLFLHGIGGNRANWRPQLLAVADQVQAAALDLRGYGGSALGSKPSTVDDYCNDILCVLSALGKTQVILCGLSYGAWIATSFAMRHPQRLAALVVSGGCTGMSEAPVAEREAFLAAREKPLSEGKTPADFADAVVNVIAGPNASVAVRVELRRSMAAIPVATYRDAVHCFTHPEERFDFAKLDMPVLLMTGEHDRLASPAEIGGVADRIQQQAHLPNVRFEVIAGAGHVCNVEPPAAYNAVLREFLSGLAA